MKSQVQRHLPHASVEEETGSSLEPNRSHSNQLVSSRCNERHTPQGTRWKWLRRSDVNSWSLHTYVHTHGEGGRGRWRMNGACPSAKACVCRAEESFQDWLPPSPMENWGSNSGHQTCQQVPFHTEPSNQSYFCSILNIFHYTWNWQVILLN